MTRSRFDDALFAVILAATSCFGFFIASSVTLGFWFRALVVVAAAIMALLAIGHVVRFEVES